MKHYDLDTKFEFGKFKGNTLKEVLDLQPSYIEWCILNLDGFCIEEFVMNTVRNAKPEFLFSKETEDVLTEKRKQLNNYKTINKTKSILKTYPNIILIDPDEPA